MAIVPFLDDPYLFIFFRPILKKLPALHVAYMLEMAKILLQGYKKQSLRQGSQISKSHLG